MAANADATAVADACVRVVTQHAPVQVKSKVSPFDFLVATHPVFSFLAVLSRAVDPGTAGIHSVAHPTQWYRAASSTERIIGGVPGPSGDCITN